MEIVQVDENTNVETTVKEVNPPESIAPYDPAKKYQWTPETKFVLNGQEFGILLNTIRAILQAEEAQKVMLAINSSNALDSVLAKAVAGGVVKEAPEQDEIRKS